MNLLGRIFKINFVKLEKHRVYYGYGCPDSKHFHKTKLMALIHYLILKETHS